MDCSGLNFRSTRPQTAADRADIVNGALYQVAGQEHERKPGAICRRKRASTEGLLDYISYVFLHHSMSPALRQAATSAANAASTPEAKVQAALYVVLTSGEYQIIQ